MNWRSAAPRQVEGTNRIHRVSLRDLGESEPSVAQTTSQPVDAARPEMQQAEKSLGPDDQGGNPTQSVLFKREG